VCLKPESRFYLFTLLLLTSHFTFIRLSSVSSILTHKEVIEEGIGVVNGTDVKNAPVIIKPVEALCMTAYSPSNKPVIGYDGKEGHDAEEGTLFRPFKNQPLS
jgi:hypothetical protein